MTFIISSSALLKNTQIISGVIASHTVLPVLENFLFEIKDKKLKIIASDLETTMSVEMQVESKEDIRFCIPSKTLIETLKNISEQPLIFNVDEENLIEIKSDKGKYNLRGENANDFPKETIPAETRNVQIPASILLSAIQYTIFCIGTDENRPAMTGVHFELENNNQINFVSTDAHRLALLRKKNIEYKGDAKGIVVPKKPLILLKSILLNVNEDVLIQFSDKHLFIESSTFKLASRLIDAPFPEYRVVIPKENPFKLTVQKESLVLALKRVMIYSNKSNYLVSLHLSSNKLNLVTLDIDYNNEAREEIDCIYEGDDLKIGFNARLFHESISAINNENITIEILNPQKGVIIKPAEQEEDEEILYLAMPLSVDF